MYQYEYPHPAVTTDVVVFSLVNSKLCVLLVQRGSEPFKSMWALPGGFIQPDETVEQCALRELVEETGVKDTPVERFSIYSEPDRDPRERVITVAHFTCARSDEVKLKAGTDASEASWFDIGNLPQLAFDHAQIFDDALSVFRERVLGDPIIARMLPESFSLSDLQSAYEAVLGKELDKRNFRRVMGGQDWLDPTGEKAVGAHRPAKLYAFRPDRKMIL